MTVDQVIARILTARTKADFKAVDALLDAQYPKNATPPLVIAQALEAYELMRTKVK
jgi:hypothetical protein